MDIRCTWKTHFHDWYVCMYVCMYVYILYTYGHTYMRTHIPIAKMRL